jgi:hypothetical protein
MCIACSRRHLLAGTFATLAVGLQPMSAASQTRIACALAGGSRTPADGKAQSGDTKFDNAVIAELRQILAVIPVNPGFQYVEDENAFSRDDTWVAGTKGTVLIGLKLVHDLLKPDGGGLSVACVLAHECGHIYQFFSEDQFYDRLSGPTQRLQELHADVLAGFYMKRRLGPATSALGVVQKAMIDFGKYNSADPKDHGTPGQRNAAIDKGFVLASKGIKFENAAREGEVYVRTL